MVTSKKVNFFEYFLVLEIIEFFNQSFEPKFSVILGEHLVPNFSLEVRSPHLLIVAHRVKVLGYLRAQGQGIVEEVKSDEWAHNMVIVPSFSLGSLLRIAAGVGARFRHI
jgi:hypothetical protein